jgi:cytochrome c oxidase cbb3-type subunit 3/ubiquinol-cytochrome c reductase cytochrome c subunit
MDFPTLYSQNCSGCHGAEGKNGPAYPLSTPVYQALVDEQQLRQVIINGRPGTLMPAFAASAGGTLTDPQIDVLVKGMRAAWYKPDALALVDHPPYQAVKQGDATHGAAVYTTYCASCHGVVGQSAKAKAGSITNTAFLGLVSDQMLRTVIIAGRPDIGQPDWRSDQPAHPMSDQEVTDVVAWLKNGKGAQQ